PAGNELALNKAGCMNRLAPPVEVSKAEARTTIQSKLRWVIMVLVIAATRLSAQTADSSDEIQQLKALVLQLQTRVSQLETQASKKDARQPANVPSNALVERSTNANSTALTEVDRKALDFLHDTTLNFTRSEERRVGKECRSRCRDQH